MLGAAASRLKLFQHTISRRLVQPRRKLHSGDPSTAIQRVERICLLAARDPKALEELTTILDPRTVRTIEKRFSLTKETAPASEAKIEPPDPRALKLVAFTYGIPFVGFGFCDNAIMLLCSDYIESNFHHILGISTLGAAGLGNCVSDVAGLYLAGFVESLASKLRIPKHGLTQMQLEHRSARIAKSVGMSVGVVIGCVLGLFPLAWPADYRLWPAPDDGPD